MNLFRLKFHLHFAVCCFHKHCVDGKCNRWQPSHTQHSWKCNSGNHEMMGSATDGNHHETCMEVQRRQPWNDGKCKQWQPSDDMHGSATVATMAWHGKCNSGNREITRMWPQRKWTQGRWTFKRADITCLEFLDEFQFDCTTAGATNWKILLFKHAWPWTCEFRITKFFLQMFVHMGELSLASQMCWWGVSTENLVLIKKWNATDGLPFCAHLIVLEEAVVLGRCNNWSRLKQCVVMSL